MSIDRHTSLQSVIDACCQALNITPEQHPCLTGDDYAARNLILVRTVERMQDHHRSHHERDKRVGEVLSRLAHWFSVAGRDDFRLITDKDASVALLYIEHALHGLPVPNVKTVYPMSPASSPAKRIRELEGENALLRAKLAEVGKHQ